MATYHPPQPLWKRNVAGSLDFLLSVAVFGYLLNLFFGATSDVPVVVSNAAGTIARRHVFSLSGWAALALVGLTIAYFVVLGRSGGTVFQRLFGMRRAS
jgi:RDD family